MGTLIAELNLRTGKLEEDLINMGTLQPDQEKSTENYDI